jgi:hypothetical protein
MDPTLLSVRIGAFFAGSACVGVMIAAILQWVKPRWTILESLRTEVILMRPKRKRADNDGYVRKAA